jgi:hypothetical protein
MKNKSIAAYIITLVLCIVFAQSNAQHADTLRGIRDTLHEVQKSMSDLRRDVDRKGTLTDKTFSALSTELTMASWVLVFFTVVLTISGFIFGTYISRMASRASAVENTVRDLFNKAQLIQTEIEKTENAIKNNIKSIYDQLKKAETDSIVERLSKEPRDISNLCGLLLTRDLSKENFIELKSSFLRIAGKPEYAREEFSYRLVLFQHFSRESILADDLRDIFINDFTPFMNSAFENDIVKSTKDIFSTLTNSGASYFKSVSNRYFEGLQYSKYATDNSVFDAIISTLNSQIKAVAVYRALLGNERLLGSKMLYGEKIINFYHLNATNPDFAALRQDIEATLSRMGILALRPFFYPTLPLPGTKMGITGTRATLILSNSGQTASQLTFTMVSAGITLIQMNHATTSANSETRIFTVDFGTPPRTPRS